MEPWSYDSEAESLSFSAEMDYTKTSVGWGSRPSGNFDIKRLISDKNSVERVEYMDHGYTEFIRKQPQHSKLSAGTHNGESNWDFSRRIASPCCLVPSNSFYEEEDHGSKVSSCYVESSQDSTLIDLKLGRFVDCKDMQNDENFKRSIASSVHPSLTAKRVRTASSYTQTPLCQVYGCNKDLSTSKDYHKRHKVCEAHTKTPKVIVNGHEQRFCQQCSRFHLLAEFDESKRSCRRRLAGHNERRRKPQFNILSGKPDKLLQSYRGLAGNNFLGTSLARGASFVFPGIYPSGIVFPEVYEQAYQSNGKPSNAETLPSSTRGSNFSNTTAQGSSRISSSSCALSLLSAQSQNLASHSTGTLIAKPKTNQFSYAHQSPDPSFDINSGVLPLEKYAANGDYLSGMNSMDTTRTESIFVPNVDNAFDLKIEADETYRESDFFNAKYSLSPERGSTVDLLQLSSHLKRVEQQRHTQQFNPQSEDCCFLT